MARKGLKTARKGLKTRKEKKARRVKKTRKHGKRLRMRGGYCEPPGDSYSHHNDCNIEKCDENMDPIEIKVAGEFDTEDEIPAGDHIFVVKVDSPDVILYHPVEGVWDCETGEEWDEIKHSCLAEGDDVLCAGRFDDYQGDGNITIDNWSGHYLPDSECLYHVRCLLQELGYTVQMRYFVPEETRTYPFGNNNNNGNNGNGYNNDNNNSEGPNMNQVWGQWRQGNNSDGNI